MLSADGKEPEDNHTGPHHVGVSVLEEKKTALGVFLNGCVEVTGTPIPN